MKLIDPSRARRWIPVRTAAKGAAVYLQDRIGPRRMLYRCIKASNFFRT